MRCSNCRRVVMILRAECPEVQVRRYKWWVPHCFRVGCVSHTDHRFLALAFGGHRLDEKIVRRVAERTDAAAFPSFRIYVAPGTFVPDLLHMLATSRHGSIIVA